MLKPTPSPSTANATPAMTDDTILPFSFPAVHAKKITAAFDGSRLTSNGGVMLLAMAERRLGLADKLALVFPDRRDPTRVLHSLVDMFRSRMFAICCGYEDADDLDHLRSDPAFKLACGRLPDTGRDRNSLNCSARLLRPHCRFHRVLKNPAGCSASVCLKPYSPPSNTTLSELSAVNRRPILTAAVQPNRRAKMYNPCPCTEAVGWSCGVVLRESVITAKSR